MVLHRRLASEGKVSALDLRPELLPLAAPVWAAYWRLLRYADGSPVLAYSDVVLYLDREVVGSEDDREFFYLLLLALLREHRRIESAKHARK